MLVLQNFIVRMLEHDIIQSIIDKNYKYAKVIPTMFINNRIRKRLEEMATEFNGSIEENVTDKLLVIKLDLEIAATKYDASIYQARKAFLEQSYNFKNYSTFFSEAIKGKYTQEQIEGMYANELSSYNVASSGSVASSSGQSSSDAWGNSDDSWDGGSNSWETREIEIEQPGFNDGASNLKTAFSSGSHEMINVMVDAIKGIGEQLALINQYNFERSTHMQEYTGLKSDVDSEVTHNTQTESNQLAKTDEPLPPTDEGPKSNLPFSDLEFVNVSDDQLSDEEYAIKQRQMNLLYMVEDEASIYKRRKLRLFDKYPSKLTPSELRNHKRKF